MDFLKTSIKFCFMHGLWASFSLISFPGKIGISCFSIRWHSLHSGTPKAFLSYSNGCISRDKNRWGFCNFLECLLFYYTLLGINLHSCHWFLKFVFFFQLKELDFSLIRWLSLLLLVELVVSTFLSNYTLLHVSIIDADP